ncbi:pectate lyase [Caulobacter radicis]|nr:pectate lyase [Caulobacter radicis]
MATRQAPRDGEIVVELAEGTWRIEKPLTFTAADGGRNRIPVTWRAAPGAHPVVSGAIQVTGWKRSPDNTDIWVADVPKGLDTRQLWVNERLATRAIRKLDYDQVTVTPDGLTFKDPALSALAGLPGQNRIEIEASGWWTYRFATVDQISTSSIKMQQPGWRNNLIGFDTISRSFAGKEAKLFISNALAFLDEPGEWYLDPLKGKLYYRPRHGEEMAAARVELPRVGVLVSIAGSPERPVADLVFKGLTFAYSSWMGPSSPIGYADQQTGAYMAEEIPNYPENPTETCSFGCPAFEAVRSRWSFMPAAVQVAAATRVTFSGNRFLHLGSNALGIGNDAGANISGVGLGAQSIDVTRNVFRDLGAAAIAVGGIRAEAHHPPSPTHANRLVTISDNRIEDFGQSYQGSAGVLATYVDRVSIVHNDVSGGPYDGIDVGWGWGMWDEGGVARYHRFGTYDADDQKPYDQPTILRGAVVAWNKVHDVKRVFRDGGAIYHLSADPGALIAWNHVYDINKQIGLYLDEGSRYVTVRENVVDGAGSWLNANTVNERPFERITIDNLAIGNWHRGGELWGQWTDFQNNRVENDHAVVGDWPEEAKKVIQKAGVRPEGAEESR